MMEKWTERKDIVTFPKVPFPMTAKKSKSVGRALEKTANNPIILLMLNQNVPVHWNSLGIWLNLSTILLQNLIQINVYRNSEKSDWLWVCWRSQVDVIVGGRLCPLLEDKQAWGKPKTFHLRVFHWLTQHHSTQICSSLQTDSAVTGLCLSANLRNRGPNYSHSRNKHLDLTLVWLRTIT